MGQMETIKLMRYKLERTMDKSQKETKSWRDAKKKKEPFLTQP